MSPPSIDLLLSVAHAHHTAGRHAEAEGLYQQVLVDEPYHAGALNRLGVLLMQTDRAEAGVVRFRQAVGVTPNDATVLSNLGAALRKVFAVTEAIDVLERAVHIDPTLAMAYLNLAASLLDRDRPADALVASDRVIALEPGNADGHINRGNALKALFRWEEAVDAYRTALALQPRTAAAYSNLGIALSQMNDLSGAIAHYRRAIELDPSYAEAFGNLANALAANGDLNSALLAARRGVQLSPNFVHGHWNLAIVLLSRGDYLAGFEEYEWRFRARGDNSLARFPMPRWNGEDLQGKTIILHAEQGFGDAIQFVRYVPLIAQRGATTILESHPELVTLFATVQGVSSTIARGEALPAADFHCPLMSLPWRFGTTLRTLPHTVPYLHVSAEKRSGRFTVGLVWAGNPKHKNDARRSMRFAQLGSLLTCDADFISLQRDAIEDVDLPSGVGDDFLQTARFIAGLDLVIAVDTAVAHLSAALGIPTWIMLAAGPDWRWFIDRSDSPWYPTVRLFRQQARDDWTQAVEQVAIELSAILAKRGPSC